MQVLSPDYFWIYIAKLKLHIYSQYKYVIMWNIIWYVTNYVKSLPVFLIKNDNFIGTTLKINVLQCLLMFPCVIIVHYWCSMVMYVHNNRIWVYYWCARYSIVAWLYISMIANEVVEVSKHHWCLLTQSLLFLVIEDVCTHYYMLLILLSDICTQRS